MHRGIEDPCFSTPNPHGTVSFDNSNHKKTYFKKLMLFYVTLNKICYKVKGLKNLDQLQGNHATKLHVIIQLSILLLNVMMDSISCIQYKSPYP